MKKTTKTPFLPQNQSSLEKKMKKIFLQFALIVLVYCLKLPSELHDLGSVPSKFFWQQPLLHIFTVLSYTVPTMTNTGPRFQIFDCNI